MARIFDLTEALKELIPVVDGWPLHMQVEPLAGELPPWVIVTITNNGIIRNEIGGAIAGDGRIELRCVSDNTDSVNIWCDDHAIPALQGVIPKCDGFACSCLTFRHLRRRTFRDGYGLPVSGARPPIRLHLEPP